MLKDKFELQFFAEPEGSEAEGEDRGSGSSVLNNGAETPPDDNTSSNEGNSTSESKNDEQRQGDGSENDKKKDDDTSEGAPEEYKDFKLPEGVKADEESTKEFNDIAKELNLTQDQAQKLVDMYSSKIEAQSKLQQEAAVNHLVEVKEGWNKDLKEDWGDDYNKNCSYVTKAVEGADPEFMALLSGQDPKFPGVVMADHPAVAKFLSNLGKRMGEDTLATGKPGQGKRTRSEIMYGTVDREKGE